MNPGNLKTAVLKLQYAGFKPVQPLLDRLLERGLRSATILRGRLTARGASYEIAVTGAPEVVEDALRMEPKPADRSRRLVSAIA